MICSTRCPGCFCRGEHASKARHDYWYTISQRFTEAYSQQLGEWCEQQGLAFTGHYLMENELGTGTIARRRDHAALSLSARARASTC